MPKIELALTVRELTASDLASCAWSGGPGHLDTVAEYLSRDDVDYLAVCPPSGLPVAIGAVHFGVREGAGELTQLAVHPALQSCGIGTVLIGALEECDETDCVEMRKTVRVLTTASPDTSAPPPPPP